MLQTLNGLFLQRLSLAELFQDPLVRPLGSHLDPPVALPSEHWQNCGYPRLTPFDELNFWPADIKIQSDLPLLLCDALYFGLYVQVLLQGCCFCLSRSGL